MSPGLRGGLAGALAFVALSLLAGAIVLALGGEDDAGGVDGLTLLSWALLAVAGAGAAALGTRFAAGAGAPPADAVRIGVLGPVVVALAGLATDLADGALVALAAFVAAAAGAVAGANAFMRRLLGG